MWKYFIDSEAECIHWDVVAMQFPTILSLAAFTLVLVPIRIPTLAMITGRIADKPHTITSNYLSGDEVDFDSELKAQGQCFLSMFLSA